MNVLVTGAAGTVGSETVEKLLLLDKNINISVFDLDNSSVRKKMSKFENKVNIMYGEITNYEQVQKVCKNQDVIIHLAAIIPPLADYKPDLAYDVNVNGTRNIIKAIKTNDKDTMLIYSSSISVYGDRINNPDIYVTDKLEASDGDEYAKTKIMAEKLIQESGIRWTIFRLTAIFGIRNHKINKLMFHMPLDTPIELATAEDTGRAFALATLNTEKIQGQIFNLSGGKECRISYREFLKRNFLIYGLGKLKFPKNAFASKNFHCAYYADGDKLEEILHFRKDTIDTYFEKLKANYPPVFRFFTKIVNSLVQKILLMYSEPYQALRKKDTAMINRFFGQMSY